MSPAPRPHATDGRACWCNPRLLTPCPECDDHRAPVPDCWRCGGDGLVTTGPWESRAVIVVHGDEVRDD